MNKVVFGILVAALLPFVAALNCWEQHNMPPGTWNYEAWLCVSGSNHGWIYSVGPSGHPSEDRMFKVELWSFTYSGNYPATLNCYEQFTDVEPPSRIGGKGGFGTLNSIPGGTLNSVPQRPLYSWHLLQQVTLYDGQYTTSSSPWFIAGCPPVRNTQHLSGSPPQVQIAVSWGGFGGRSAIAVPNYVSIGAPFIGYLDGYIDALTGRTASALKTKRTRR